MSSGPVSVLVPAGMLGAGFTAASIDRGIAARLYRVDPNTVRIYRLPDIRVVKISFPRPTVQGGRHDREMHAGQQHVPLSQLTLQPR